MPAKGQKLKPLDPKVAAANAASGVALDRLGRKRAGTLVNGEEEEATYHHEDGTTEIRIRQVPRDEIRCVAKAIGAGNPWKGNRCARVRMRGMLVCRTHGGTLPNIKKAAQRRLAIAALPASERLIHIALVKKKVSNRDRIRAILEILNRAGINGAQTIQIELKPWQQILQTIYGDLDPSGAEETAEEEEGVDYEIPEGEILDDDDEEEEYE